MEAKVDVRKLQILNDRINQTIDALNQVRLSVHGLGHSGIQNPLSFGGYGMQQGLGTQNPFFFGPQTPFQSPFQSFGGPLGQLSSQLGQQQGLGFQHSPFTQYPNPFTNPYNTLNVMSPWGQTPQVGSPWSGVGGVTGGIGGGLFHSNPEVIDKQIAEVRASDPYRITQTFPFVIP